MCAGREADDELNSSGIGLEAATTSSGQTFVSIVRSNISHDNSDGVRASSAGTAITLKDSLLSFNNGTAVNSMVAGVGGSTIRISDNVINNNNVSFGTTGNLLSTGDNRVEGNGGGVPLVLSGYTVS